MRMSADKCPPSLSYSGMNRRLYSWRRLSIYSLIPRLYLVCCIFNLNIRSSKSRPSYGLHGGSTHVALGWEFSKFSLIYLVFMHTYIYIYITDLSYTSQMIPLISLSNQHDRSIAEKIQYPERWRHQSNILGIDRIRAQSLHEEQSPNVGGQHTIGGGPGLRRG